MRANRVAAIERTGELARVQAGVVSRGQLRRAGVRADDVQAMVRARFLRAVTHRVLVVAGSSDGPAQRMWVGLLDAGPASVISHRSAAGLHRIGRIAFGGVDVLELEPVAHRGARAARHRTTYLPDAHRTVVDGLPTTTIARTVFDLASLVSARRRRRGLPSLTERQVARALDDALMRKLTIPQLDRVIATLGGRGRPGTTLMRALADARRPGYVATESELEDLFVAILDRYGSSVPDRQVVLGGADLVGRVDFTFLDARVVVEVDGRRHHSALLDAEADRWRDLELAAAGFLVVRVTWAQLIEDPERFVARLEQLLEARRRQSAG